MIANSKGGVGKSTLAVHLAAWLHAQGHRVTLADCDTQQSSSEWIREAVPEIKAVRLDNPDVILNELPTFARIDADFVVADGPGSQTETSRALLLRADLAIVPCKASMLEVRASPKLPRSCTGSGHTSGQTERHHCAEHGRQELSSHEGHEGCCRRP